MLEFYQKIPLMVHPIALTLGPITLRWYSLGYIFGFITTYVLCLLRMKYEHPRFAQCSRKDLEDLINYCIIGVVVGARLGFVIFYDPYYFFYEPHRIFWPFRGGEFVGISGMSYHGGMLGVVVGFYLFHKVKKGSVLLYGDLGLPCAAVGYTWGRLGNFMNGELYGKPTENWFGMYFFDHIYSSQVGGYIKSPFLYLRHPSQLYEAVLEGLVVGVIVWSIRNKKWLPLGYSGPAYLMAYAVTRVFAEYFREPDDSGDGTGTMYLKYISMGQFLSILMFVSGIVFLWSLYKNQLKNSSRQVKPI